MFGTNGTCASDPIADIFFGYGTFMVHMGHEFGGFKNPPEGFILCARKDEVVARYALEGLPNKVMAAEYRTALPDEKTLADEIRRSQEILEKHKKLPLLAVPR